MREVDYIIVGQGIAGSAVGAKLLERGKKVLIFDLSKNNISSRVAAGIYNPITGRRMIKTWKAEQLWPSFTGFYQRMEVLLKAKFFYPKEHYRPFRTPAEVNDTLGRSADPAYDPFIKSIRHESVYPELLTDTYGGAFLSQSGYLDIPEYLDQMKKYFIDQESFLEEHLDVDELIVNNHSISYKDIHASRIIFCNGWNENENPYLPVLPFRPVKGELLKIQFEIPIDTIFNRGVFLLPKENNEVVVGSTYERNDLNDRPTEKGGIYLKEKLEELIKIPYTILDHYAGVRPSTLDRRPFVGIHPQHETIGVLNGLGTKGVTLAPYFADELISFIEGKGEIDKEADIKRYL